MAKIKVNNNIRLSKEAHPTLGNIVLLDFVHTDSKGCIQVFNTDTESSYRITPSTARKLAKALKVAADEAEKLEKGLSQAW